MKLVSKTKLLQLRSGYQKHPVFTSCSASKHGPVAPTPIEMMNDQHL